MLFAIVLVWVLAIGRGKKLAAYLGDISGAFGTFPRLRLVRPSSQPAALASRMHPSRVEFVLIILGIASSPKSMILEE